MVWRFPAGFILPFRLQPKPIRSLLEKSHASKGDAGRAGIARLARQASGVGKVGRADRNWSIWCISFNELNRPKGSHEPDERTSGWRTEIARLLRDGVGSRGGRPDDSRGHLRSCNHNVGAFHPRPMVHTCRAGCHAVGLCSYSSLPLCEASNVVLKPVSLVGMGGSLWKNRQVTSWAECRDLCRFS
jgi:hypothetical protein